MLRDRKGPRAYTEGERAPLCVEQRSSSLDEVGTVGQSERWAAQGSVEVSGLCGGLSGSVFSLPLGSLPAPISRPVWPWSCQ